jgi:hypothetical protein
MEDKFFDISYNISLLMVALSSNIEPFGEFGSVKSDIGSDKKMGDNEDLEKE